MLTKYSKLKLGFNEKAEGIELIRALENDMKIGTFIATNSGFAVDVNQDLMRAINVMPNNRIRKNIRCMNKKVLILGASSEIGVEIMKIYLKKTLGLLLIIIKEIKIFLIIQKIKRFKKVKFNFLTKLENIDKFSKSKIFKNCDILINALGRIKELDYKKITSKEIIDSFKVNLLPSIIFNKI